MSDQPTPTRTILMQDICAVAGYRPGDDGKLALPNTQEAADAIAVAARGIVLDGRADWQPGDPQVGDITLSGAGPVWAYLCVQHALHGLARSLTYASPAATIRVHGHHG